MPRPENPIPGTSPIELREFAEGLRALRRKDGYLDYRAMSARANCSAPSLSQAAAGRKLPTWEVTRAFVNACGGSEVEWRTRWQLVKQVLESAPAEALNSAGLMPVESTSEYIQTSGVVARRPYRAATPVTPPTSKRLLISSHVGNHASEGIASYVAGGTIVSVEDVGQGLRQVRAAAGSPSLRELSLRTKLNGSYVPPSTLADAFSGKRLPSRMVVNSILAACGVPPTEREEFDRAWLRLKALWSRFWGGSARNRGRVPGQREQNPPTTDLVSGDPVLPAGDFDVRVRISLALHSQDAKLIIMACRARGWDCTPDSQVSERELGPDQQSLDSHWFVDVPRVGAALGATSEAEMELRNVLKPFGTMTNMRGGWVLQPSAMTTLTYRVYQRPPRGRTSWLRRLHRLGISLGLHDTGEVIYAHSDRHAVREFARRRELHNGPERPERAALRRPFLTSSRSQREANGRYRTRREDAKALRTAGVMITIFSLVVLTQPRWSAGSWGTALLVALAALCAALLYLAQSRITPPLSTRAKVLFSAAGSVLSTGLGILVGNAGPVANAWGRVVPLLLVFVFFGLRSLVRGTSTGKMALWAVPFVVSLAPPLLRGVGDIAYGSYLSGFGLRLSDVTVSGLNQMWPAFRPLGAGVATGLLTLAMAGFARRVHVDLGKILIVPLAVMFGLATVLAATQSGEHASTRAQREAAARHLPGGFRAITASAVCVKPTTTALATKGAPLPQGTPLLTFDPLAANVALWNPATGQVTRVPGAGVSLVTVRGLDSSCP
ncbi:helix-turn-helix transcriptional regulator [Kitasatospora sp. MAA4]|uniref:helix-turn-helix transcriptional regulator n=1 Tax=Kitasatospora sp. MAA4 TaxID=3035093 RepID=UPI002477226D|nr:helix-turn-helix transcriptional regulator [Kitasatospora sp. MAA4]